MSEERFAAIEYGLASLGTKFDGLDVKVGRLIVKVETIEVKVDVLDRKVDALGTKVDALATKVSNLDRRFDDLGREMRVLHEDTIANIRALAPDPEEFERKFTAADDKLRQDNRQP